MHCGRSVRTQLASGSSQIEGDERNARNQRETAGQPSTMACDLSDCGHSSCVVGREGSLLHFPGRRTCLFFAHCMCSVCETRSMMAHGRPFLFQLPNIPSDHVRQLLARVIFCQGEAVLPVIMPTEKPMTLSVPLKCVIPIAGAEAPPLASLRNLLSAVHLCLFF